MDLNEIYLKEYREGKAKQEEFREWAKIYLGRVKTFADLDNYVVERDKWILCYNSVQNESLKCVLQDRAFKDCKDRLLKTCSVCGKMFDSVSLSTRCQNSHLNGIYRCHCGRSYNYSGNLARHRRNCL